MSLVRRAIRWGLVVLLLAFESPAAMADSRTSSSATQAASGLLLFPEEELFSPLLADLRWPRFSAAHQWRLGTDEFDRVGSVSFGETFAFVQNAADAPRRWEVGLHANMDATFDMTSRSFDLANEDYFVALAFTYRVKGVDVLARISHTSSHLGDEYLLAKGLVRESVSYESVDVLASVRPLDFLRLYGGVGSYLNPSPAFDPFISQWGVELTSPVSFAAGALTPIFGVDVQIRQENDGVPEVAVLAGMRLARHPEATRNVECFARFYHGRSPDGQFFSETIDLVGLGARLNF